MSCVKLAAYRDGSHGRNHDFIATAELGTGLEAIHFTDAIWCGGELASDALEGVTAIHAIGEDAAMNVG